MPGEFIDVKVDAAVAKDAAVAAKLEEVCPVSIFTLGNRSREELTLDLEMLVRAYDPCISCSCHLLDVEFVNDTK